MANPIVVRSLDEIKFWSRIMKEHALFLTLGFTHEQKKLIMKHSSLSPFLKE